MIVGNSLYLGERAGVRALSLRRQQGVGKWSQALRSGIEPSLIAHPFAKMAGWPDPSKPSCLFTIMFLKCMEMLMLKLLALLAVIAQVSGQGPPTTNPRTANRLNTSDTQRDTSRKQ